jgi:hypothetical protein
VSNPKRATPPEETNAMKIQTTTLRTLCSLLALPLLAVGCYAGDDERPQGEADTDDEADTEAAGSEDGADDADDDGIDPDGDDDAGDTDGPTDEPPPGMARIRVIHGSPDAPAVDIYVEGSDEPLVTGLAYSETSAWIDVPAGEYNVLVRAAGASPLDTPVYETGTLALPEGAIVSALAAGLLDAGENNAFRVIPLVDGFEDARPGEARVRIVHAGVDAPGVDIDVGDDGTAEIESLTRFTETGAAGVPLPAGEALQIGILAGGERVTAFTTPPLAEGQELIVVATGRLDRLAREADGFSLLAVDEAGGLGLVRQNPVVYALHAGADAPEVDICAGDTVIASHLYFGGMARAQVPPGAYDLDFYAAPSNCAGTVAASDSTPMLEPGERYLAIATGELTPSAEEPPLQIVAFRDDFPLDAPEDAVFSLVHSASAPMVDVGIVTGTQIEAGNLLEEDLKWPSQSQQFSVEPFTYQIGVAAAGGQMPLHPIASFHVPATAGMRAFVVAAGDLVPETTEAGFRLLAVDTAGADWTVTAIVPN